MAEAEPTIPSHIRLSGRFLNAAVAHAPWLWPVIKVPMRRFFDNSAAGWDIRTGAGSIDHLMALASAVTHVSPVPERALDLGTGTGEAALFLAREYPRASIRGVDLSEEMIAAARAKCGLDPEGRIAFRVADAAALPFTDDAFDLITHVNVPPFFKEIARVLRPGGHVIFTATLGAQTPFHTPDSVLERGLHRHGIEVIAKDAAGRGTYLVGRAGRG